MVRTAINELADTGDMEEFMESVADAAKQAHVTVTGKPMAYAIVVETAEAGAKVRSAAGAALAALAGSGSVSADDVYQATKEMSDMYDDVVIDVPKLPEYLGDILRPALQAGSLPPKAVETLPCASALCR